jgi:hypothetical protein
MQGARSFGWRSAVWLLLACAVCACGGDDDDDDGKNVCEQACDKVETCPSQQCTLNLDDCSGATKTAAECVLRTSCDQLLTCRP